MFNKSTNYASTVLEQLGYCCPSGIYSASGDSKWVSDSSSSSSSMSSPSPRLCVILSTRILIMFVRGISNILRQRVNGIFTSCMSEVMPMQIR